MSIKKTIKIFLRKIYLYMQKHYLTFRILVMLEKMGILQRMFIMFAEVRKSKTDIMQEMAKNRVFLEKNSQRIKDTKELFSDERSKDIFDACMNYRAYRTRIPNHLFSETDQYFVEGIVSLSNNEVFVDCGAFIGDTIQQVVDLARKKRITDYSIIAFEPSRRNVRLIQKFFKNNNNMVLIDKGISDCEKKVYFEEGGSRSRITNKNIGKDNYIETTSLDSISQCQNATFIKMDIEGAELSALQGAKNIIQRNRPKLAICIYHSNEDMVTIPQYIHSLVPEYKLYVRHHSRGAIETVLYAVI